jgi:GAF domain-containing protein
MSAVQKHINHGTYLNWFVIVMVAAIGGTGLFFSLPTLAEKFDTLDLLEHTQEAHVFIAACSLLVLGGLVLQRMDLVGLWKQYLQAQKELAESAEKHSARVYALLNVSKMMVAQNDLAAVFDCVAKTCVDVFACHQASLMMYDKETDELEVRAVSGRKVPPGMLGTKQKLGVGIAGWVALRREPLLLHPRGKPEQYPGLEFKQRGVVTAMVVPIILRDELVGVINVSSRDSQAIFDNADLKALQVFAENVGTAIRHTEQAEWMRSTIQKLQGQREHVAAPRPTLAPEDV